MTIAVMSETIGLQRVVIPPYYGAGTNDGMPAGQDRYQSGKAGSQCMEANSEKLEVLREKSGSVKRG
jgi:hypothetical protein